MRGTAFRKSLTTALEHLAIHGRFSFDRPAGPDRFALLALLAIVAHP